jgi:hypothetical protein
MSKEPEYLTVGKTPLERVVKLLSKLDSIRVSKDKGSLFSKATDGRFHKYVEPVELIFKNLPKPLRWRSFLNNDLILLTDIPSKVQKASIKPDLIFFDPPYFKKMAAHYMKGSISDFSRSQYLNFFKDFFCLMRDHSKPSTRIAFLNADFRDFKGIPAFDEDPENAILLLEYAKLLELCGWKITHLIDCPMSTERFSGNMVSKMQDKRTLGIILKNRGGVKSQQNKLAT